MLEDINFNCSSYKLEKLEQDLTMEEVLYLYDFHNIYTSYAFIHQEEKWYRKIISPIETRECAIRWFTYEQAG